jgi:hypothetical protein
MAERIELWRQEKIEQLTPGESWTAENDFNIHRYRDGWHFYWKLVGRAALPCEDLGRFFDEDHIWEMRNFMSGLWDRGVKIEGPKPEELL